MKHLLSNLSDHIEETKKIYYTWTSSNKGIVLANRVHLNIISLEDSGPIFRRLVGRLVKNRFMEQCQQYSPAWFRIRDGERRGYIVSPYEVEDDESAVPTGIIKRLEWGSRPDRFNADRVKDVEILNLLKALPTDKHTPLVQSPDFYFTTTINNALHVTLRSSPAALKRLKEIPEINMQGHLAENLPVLKGQFTRKFKIKDETRIAWPWEMVQGRGVVAADLKNIQGWHSADKLEIDSNVVSLSKW